MLIRFFLLFCCLCISISEACTNLFVSTKDGNHIVGRSMEFGQNLHSQVLVIPRGETVRSNAPNNKPGLSWTSKYGYITMNGLHMDLAVDGFNEKGLSLGLLWMPDSKYQEVSPQESSRALSTTLFSTWVLGNFATTEEVKNALPNIKVWGEPVAALNNSVPPIHFIIQDGNGSSIVVEFFEGAVKVHDNPYGTLTNFPWFEWQALNLNNFINLKALNASPLVMDGTTLGGTGQGSGLWGIPGDWTPPSRFVRATLFKQFSIQPNNTAEGVNLVEHLMNTVDIPKGDVLEKAGKNPVFDYTQWIVIKDLKNLKFYYRTYSDLSLNIVDFDKLNISAGAPKLRLDIPTAPRYRDATANLMNSKT